MFENFNTVDGDTLTAKFRAFKFPDSTYVQFRGTVNACVDKCRGIQCSNGQIGYGRRKREIAQSPEPNKIYEISMTTFIRVVDEPVADKGNFRIRVENKRRKIKHISTEIDLFFFADWIHFFQFIFDPFFLIVFFPSTNDYS